MVSVRGNVEEKLRSRPAPCQSSGVMSESPTEEMLRDPLFMLNFVAWLGLIAAILYGWV